MKEIELGNKTDHDLLVIAVTTINSLDEKLGKVCEKVELHENQLTVLQTEHDERKDTCNSRPNTNKSRLATSGSIGAILGAGLMAAIDYLLRR